MTPKYLLLLADLADPHELWRLSGIDQRGLTYEQRLQLDAGVALRRYASHRSELGRALAEGKSVLITPLSENGSAHKLVDTPADHVRLKRPPVPEVDDRCEICGAPTPCHCNNMEGLG